MAAHALAPSNRKEPGRIATLIGAAGAVFLNTAATAGGMTILFGRVVKRLIPPRIDVRELENNLYKMAFKSLPIVVVTALFTGAIMVIQAAPIVKRYGAEGQLGWGAGFGTLREIAPLLTALMLSGRVGANNTAELGTMVVTDQFDALRVLAIDPIAFLIAPRFIGIVATLFMMTLFADVLALFGAAFTGQALLGVSPQIFYNGVTSSMVSRLGFGDVANGLVKSILFGLIIALSSCHFGLSTTGGAPGVGRAVNATVVASAAGIFLIDYLVSFAWGG
ncbi:MAG: ABC transporter permease [Polyangiaceae bacterium]|nr:ABC transporter permease [Polyangiaceae bacterium]